MLTSAGLIGASAFDLDLGAPTLVAGLLTAALVLVVDYKNPIALVRNISWGVLPLVAGLFVLVEALNRTGVLAALASELRLLASSPGPGAILAGATIALASNLVNNLPAGLVAAGAIQQAAPPATMTGALLIGVDLGPNLSVTGSLATILWLTALRREGQAVSALDFLKVGLVVMPPALILSLGALIFLS